MSTSVRIVLGAGLFLLGYYLGREVGRMEAIRNELSRAHGQSGRIWDADELKLRGERTTT